MSSDVQLLIIKAGEEIPALGVVARPSHVGRAPDNDLVLSEATVSAYHATFWLEAGRAWVRDRGSKNGTFVNDTRIHGAAEVHDGDVLRFGHQVQLLVRGTIEDGASPLSAPLVVEDVDTRLRYPIVAGRFSIGAGEFANLPMDIPAEHEVSLTVSPDGEIWRVSLEDEGPVHLEEVFSVGERRLRVVRLPPAPTGTVDVGPAGFRYQLSVTLDGVAGPEATFEDPATGARYTVEAENRAVLVYVLAKQRSDARDTDDAEANSWCSDDEVSKGIWGKRGTSDANSLHVLVHRLRKELKKAGFDPWFIEKRRKAIRLALDEIQLR